jgi:hypothetical protein
VTKGAKVAKKSTHKKSDNTERTAGTAAIKENAAIAALAMQGADPWQRVIVYLFYGIILITILYLTSPPYATDKFKALVLVVPFLVVTAIFVIVRYKKLSSGEQVTSSGPKTIQLSAVVSDRVRIILEDFRKQAHAFLKTKDPTLSDNEVRANIFFPEYGNSKKWDDYVLKIRFLLHLNMEEPEIGITLCPGQGVTDKVFQTGEAQTAKRMKSDSAVGGDWDKVYHITDELAAVIHPDLKWIISMPIKGQTGPCIGVMNVDGLVHEFKTDTLVDCAGRLTTFPYTVFGLVTGI